MTDTHAAPQSALVGGMRHSPVVTISAQDSLWDAWHVMFVSGLRHLVVVGDDGMPVGLLCDRAVLTDLPLSEEHLSHRTVGDVMSYPGSVGSQDSAYEAAGLMTRHAVDALPITDDSGRVTGLITASDLAAWVASS